MNKKQKIFLGVGLGVLAASAGGILWWRSRSSSEEVDTEMTATDLGQGKASKGNGQAGGSTVGTDVSSVGIGEVANIPSVTRPIMISSLPIVPTNPYLKGTQLQAWEVVSVGERIAPKGNGIFVLTFKNRKPANFLKNGEQIVVETKGLKASPFRGVTKIHKVWIDTNGKLAGVFIRLNDVHGKLGGMSGTSLVGTGQDKKLEAQFRQNEYLADGDFVVLKHK